jgi:predicted amidophosphoribosyltransferase
MDYPSTDKCPQCTNDTASYSANACPYCGSVNDYDYKQCHYCGAPRRHSDYAKTDDDWKANPRIVMKVT